MGMESGDARGLTRRQLLQAAGFFAAAAVAGGPVRALAATGGRRMVERAAATPPAGSDLGAVEHLVFLMMENRSYDHYFGAYPKGRGFDDHPPKSLGVFAQAFPGATTLDPPNVLLPFRLHRESDECTNDLTHNWDPMHECWHKGAMDSWVRVHTSSAYEGAHGAMTMGYYTREELGFYYALADAFTLCDAYHCSVIGPTHPNRLMATSGTIDPDGTHGGPIIDTLASPQAPWTLTNTTIQEVLEDKGVSWKVYHPSNVGVTGEYLPLTAYPIWNPAWYDPTLNPEVLFVADNILPFFAQYRNPTTPLYQKAFLPTFPNDFVADVQAGTLPSVSWIIPPLGFDEHPSASPDHGMYFTSLVLNALLKNPAVWAKTAFILMYDENDGFFDHVAPPTAPAGTPGEYLKALPPNTLNTAGILGPIGLGMRVPAIVMSPFSRGGHVATEVFDHTSQLKLIGERFGVEVPNVSAWRRSVVGDLTSALFQNTPSTSVPAFPAAPLGQFQVSGDCSEVFQESEQMGSPPTVPAHQTMPTQSGSVLPASYFFGGTPNPDAAPISMGGPGSSTTKSKVNELAATGASPSFPWAAALLAGGVAGAVAVSRARRSPELTGETGPIGPVSPVSSGMEEEEEE
ncbi:MAG: phospholipase [Actinobacteria bacterium]|nr:phospholipase [Actinomycetota bacterium]